MSDLVAPATPAAARRRVAAVVALSAASAALAGAAQPAAAATQTFSPTADAYVSSSSPSQNYGTSTDLKDDGSPTLTSYVRFAPQFTGSVTKATLRVYTNTQSSTGFDVHPVGDTTWSEKTLTYANRPAASSAVVARSGAFARKVYLDLDVTSAVQSSAPVGFALTTPSGQDFLLAARESGTLREPKLLIDTGTSTALAPTPTPTPTPSPTPSPSPSPAPAPVPSTGGVRPYDAASPWNTPIGLTASVDPASSLFMNAIADNGAPLTSDPDQYTIPVYPIDSSTPLRTVKFSGYYSTYDSGDASRVGHGYPAGAQQIPIPDGVVPPAGTDAQVELWDQSTGTQYGLWQLVKNSDGTWSATNGYRYHTGAGYYGRFADGAAGRGAGTPYLAGLVRKWEVDQGHIDHALAFAYNSPSPDFRYPASKSDGGGFGGVSGTDLPEGTRIQLDPTLTDANFTSWGLSPAAKVIARAMQTYGMYVIDHSGSSKIYLEDRSTAGWDSTITRSLVSGIPWSAFRVVSAPSPA